MFSKEKSIIAGGLLYVLFLLGTVVIVFVSYQYLSDSKKNSQNEQELITAEPIVVDKFLQLSKEEQLQVFADNLVGGGPPKDGIPSLDQPLFISTAEADAELEDTDKVFILNHRGNIFIYPQEILAWHEIVNQTFEDERVTISYCPLTGSVIAVTNDQSDFGVSGKLLNSNLIIFDRESDSEFSQILLTAISGTRFGEGLDTEPVIWSNWQLAKQKYENAKVLSVNTGFLRDYQNDPYGSYQKKNSYYYVGSPLFPLISTDDRLPAKEVVVGVYGTSGQHLAFLKSAVKGKGSISKMIEDTQITAVYDESLDTVYVYTSDPEVKILADFMDVMWFAWSAHFPDTELMQ
ncbi:hypothetical protein COY25_03715 [Candidatus Uhrbacteria bacterium CG_4_10_14_0_2_um_filter_41_7]|uniref:DUF3179 domain-containing protein n=1 Tax=Candidatus Uhrbacteria bacterium CG_4_9_14_3_um_filter_41_35 TaxID=1975034 RepID=A0A2M7XFF3_9BACT|nr:MAG: hypothetical protein COV92_01015 [Candidatus Uhrbacteria bacterium CG11_big_fil_rev_8_21_14_0_20_41_9]PIZ53296.1 MAG: hypothetical protein COY25_03715 [Candidatus Uhrbacteria bacterium CG_4_10_14_0_2_um_filter_41_7]PJA46592.1 MAG: hypothetical protein CO173_02380 [Candidatus Uhrbacteria bacterium CG_4_9_14_3_um_filter_41_35]